MSSAILLICSPLMPDAYSAPTTEPALVPATRSIGMPRASSAFSTPMCEKPRAAPPPSAMPIFTGFCAVAALSGRDFSPNDVHAARVADAHAIVKWRRDRRGDDIE
ncbi:hypothetical protein BVIET440_10083 [Burkholderia vietnamiensis]